MLARDIYIFNKQLMHLIMLLLIGNAWIGRFSFLIQKQNATTIQHSITNARQKEMRSGTHVNHGYSNEFLDSDRVANVYFTSDVDAQSRISS